MCAVCGATDVTEHCHRCGALTSGPVTDELRSLNAELHRLHARRDDLVRQLMAESAEAKVAESTDAGAWGAASPPAIGRSVSPQAVLAAAGVALLAAAAVVFAAVTWDRLPQLVQLAILAAAAVAAGAGARAAERRGLQATGNALVLLAAVIAGVVGWAGSEGRPDVTLSLVLVAAVAQVPHSSMVAAPALMVLAAAGATAAWLEPLGPPGRWQEEAWVSGVATVSLLSGLLAWRALGRSGARGAARVAVGALAAVAGPLAVVAALASAAGPEMPGLGIALLIPYLASGVWGARRWPLLAGAVAFLAVLVTALTLVASAGMGEEVAVALAAAPVVLVGMTVRPEVLRAPVVLGVGLVAALRLDLALQPLVGALERVAAAGYEAIGLEAPAPGPAGAETAVALVGVLVLVACLLWLLHPRGRVCDLGSLAVLGGAVAAALWLPPVLAAGLLALLPVASAATRLRGWPVLHTAVVVAAALLALDSSPADVAVWVLLAAGAVAAAARLEWWELDFHAGVLPAGAAALFVARAVGAGRPWPEFAALVIVVVALPLAVRLRRPAAEVAVWLVGLAAGLHAARMGSLAAGNAAALLAVAAAAAATWGGRQVLWHASRVAAVLASWAWLDAAGVRVLEAYAAPAALVLGAVGVLQLRRDEAASSWRALGPALSVAVVPTAAQLVADPDDLWRTLALLAVGVALGLVGRSLRLAAPLVAGGLAAFAVAAVHLWSVVDLVPRWVALTGGGAILLWAAVTYEAQLQRANRLRLRIASLG